MTERTYRFIQVDVFTERALVGNPLAVFPEAEGLSDAEMQAIALEMNLSETTFVLPPEEPTGWPRVRIFTPIEEMPFAGHPTIGTAYVLATLGRFPAGASEVALHENVGVVSVRLEGDPARPSFAWLTHPPVEWDPPIADRTGVAEALGLTVDDLLGGLDGPPLQIGGTNRFFYAPLVDRAAVDRVAISERDFLRLVDSPSRGGAFVFFFAPEQPAAGEKLAGKVYARMIVPGPGGFEDPATGSASGPLGAYLVKERLFGAAGGPYRYLSEQGTKMGRQSFIHIVVETDAAGTVETIFIGGATVPIIEGTLRLPG